MFRRILILTCLVMASCRTVGVSREIGGYAEVSPTIAHEMILDNTNIVVLDFRPSGEYSTGHVAGALSTPLETIETQLPLLVAYQTGTILVYADTQEDSVRGARLLAASGFRNVVRITGGIRDWIEGGYQTVTSQ
jgi:rhodanese-related sulfurtransferase